MQGIVQPKLSKNHKHRDKEQNRRYHLRYKQRPKQNGLAFKTVARKRIAARQGKQQYQRRGRQGHNQTVFQINAKLCRLKQLLVIFSCERLRPVGYLQGIDFRIGLKDQLVIVKP